MSIRRLDACTCAIFTILMRENQLISRTGIERLRQLDLRFMGYHNSEAEVRLNFQPTGNLSNQLHSQL